jgi:hypothetical protein
MAKSVKISILLIIFSDLPFATAFIFMVILEQFGDSDIFSYVLSLFKSRGTNIFWLHLYIFAYCIFDGVEFVDIYIVI